MLYFQFYFELTTIMRIHLFTEVCQRMYCREYLVYNLIEMKRLYFLSVVLLCVQWEVERQLYCIKMVTIVFLLPVFPVQ